MTRKRAAIWALSIVGVGVVGHACLRVYSLRKLFDESRVHDALLTAAPIVLDRCRESVQRDPQDQLDDVLRMHHEGSVSPIWFDAAGKPIDVWGTRFRVIVDSTRPPAWVRCESAGPDRIFGTVDDLHEESTQ